VAIAAKYIQEDLELATQAQWKYILNKVSTDEELGQSLRKMDVMVTILDDLVCAYHKKCIEKGWKV
jgi:hypothetical protein